METEKLKQFINNPKFCSETEKYAVACATDNMSLIPWRDSLRDAWSYLDDSQKQAVKEYRNNGGLPPLFYESK